MPFPEKKVVEELERAPIREIVGVADAWGAFVGRTGQQPWTLKIVFDHWKYPADGLRVHRLALHKQFAAFEDAKAMHGRVKPFGVMRVRVHVLESNSPGPSDGLLVEVIGEDESDAELAGIARGLREPVVVQDAQFGALKLNRLIKRFEGSATWCTSEVGLVLGLGDDLSAQQALKVAHDLWESRDAWRERVEEYAIRELLAVSNEWRQAGEAEVTAEGFKDRIKLQTIMTSADGRFEFWFEDGDLFRGHAIRVDGSLDAGPVSAGIEG